MVQMFRCNKRTCLYIFYFALIAVLLYVILKENGSSVLVDNNRKRWTRNETKYKHEYQRFHERQRHLRRRCLKVLKTNNHTACEDQQEMKNNLKYVKKKNVLYCSIEQTGNTFWRRIPHVEGGWGGTSNPTRIEISKAYDGKGGYRNMQNKKWAEVENLFKRTELVLFVRNPFSRLFSGWLDKFYSPNVFYWNKTGKDILESQRHDLDNDSIRCASDVSFVEFVNYTVHEMLSNKCIDGHFSSMYSHCLPCHLPFRYIGKYETIKEDIAALIELLDLTDAVRFNDFETDAVFDAIMDSSSWVYKEKEKVVACGVSFSCALFREWSRLQSRGLISKKMDFPYKTKEEINTLKQEQFERDLAMAHFESSPQDLKNNRHEALLQALKTLPEAVIKKLLLAFETDFDLFDYDRRPLSFAESGSTEISGFTYFSSCPQQFR
ncbi:carbohydrate sulfotransferase 8-like [Mercenaria mercenaria]|uniref:carbohydrate sulfotransferase 8-like n=1 Tax=Mercenaria mercenaria TaxID=6596 RepID=UPI00234FB1BB|nr:carbohydrate sulfotransferase 8-like [Mercenaria mercenaria]